MLRAEIYFQAIVAPQGKGEGWVSINTFPARFDLKKISINPCQHSLIFCQFWSQIALEWETIERKRHRVVDKSSTKIALKQAGVALTLPRATKASGN